jgi:hypothetical protein
MLSGTRSGRCRAWGGFLATGLMQGVLAELRASVAAARLEPFADPGACAAHLQRTCAA